MTTLGDLITQVQQIVNANVSDAQIVIAINQAIQWYANTKFWWNTNAVTLTLITGDPVVPNIPLDFGQIIEPEGLIVLQSQVRYPLVHITVLDYQSIDVQGNGLPRYYTYTNDRQFKVYTYPDKDYQLFFNYLKKYDALVSPSDQNDWTNYLTAAIKYKAVAYCYRDYLEEFEYSATFDEVAEKEFLSAYNQSLNRQATGILSTENIVDKEDIGYYRNYW